MTALDFDGIKAEWPEAFDDPAVPVIHALCDRLQRVTALADHLAESPDPLTKTHATMLRSALVQDSENLTANVQNAFDRRNR